MASFPSSVKTFTTKADNVDLYQAAHVNDLQDEVVAVEQAFLTTATTITPAWTFTEKITANKGVQFPATQVASADVNALDDYEEGTFTPSLQFGGAAVSMAYSTQTGRYTKVGNLFVAEIDIALTAKGSSTGNATITGLPAGLAPNLSTVGNMDCVTGMVGLTGTPFPVISASATTITLVQTTATGRTTLTDAAFSDTSQIRIVLVSRV